MMTMTAEPGAAFSRPPAPCPGPNPTSAEHAERCRNCGKCGALAGLLDPEGGKAPTWNFPAISSGTIARID